MASCPPSNAYLIINDKIHCIKHTVTTIGRSLGNHMVVTDPLVSRTHAEILFDSNKFVLKDLHSTGGTFVNGARVAKATLKSGDSIVLAGIAIVFAQNLPQAGGKTKAGTGQASRLGPDNEPTLREKELIWRR